MGALNNRGMSASKRLLLAEDNGNDIAMTLAVLEKHGLAEDGVVVRGGRGGKAVST